jgi:membrane protein
MPATVMKKTMTLLKDLFHRFRDDEIIGLSAQLAYFFLLSLFPFLIFMITLVGFLPFSSIEILPLIKEYSPDDKTFELISKNVGEILDSQNEGLLSFGAIATIWVASNGVNAVIRVLNRAYDVTENRSFIKERLMAIVLTVAMIFTIIVALLLPVFGKAIGLFVFSNLGLSDTFLSIWNTLRYVISFFVMVIVFSFLYYIAPNKHLHMRDIIVGAIFATVGWQLVSLAFSFYVTNFGNFSATYGSIGGIIILMIWFYLSAMIIILGGEINALLRKYRVHGI